VIYPRLRPTKPPPAITPIIRPTPTEVVEKPLVPVDANLMASIRVAKIVDDPDLRVIAETLDLIELEEDSGLDLRNLSELVLFGDVSALDDYAGFIAKEDFDKSELTGGIEELYGEEYAPLDSYRGYTIYIGDYSGDGLVLLADDKFVLGRLNAVKDVIDVKEGKEPHISEKVWDIYADLGDKLIKVALEPPLKVKREEMELFPNIASVIDDIEVIGLAFGKDGRWLTTSVRIGFASVDSAREAASVINEGINKAMDEDKWKEVKDILDRVNVVSRGSWVTITSQVSVMEAEYLKEIDLDLGGLIFDIIDLGAR
jgi:hypothetical protein